MLSCCNALKSGQGLDGPHFLRFHILGHSCPVDQSRVGIPHLHSCPAIYGWAVGYTVAGGVHQAAAGKGWTFLLPTLKEGASDGGEWWMCPQHLLYYSLLIDLWLLRSPWLFLDGGVAQSKSMCRACEW